MKLTTRPSGVFVQRVQTCMLNVLVNLDIEQADAMEAALGSAKKHADYVDCVHRIRGCLVDCTARAACSDSHAVEKNLAVKDVNWFSCFFAPYFHHFLCQCAFVTVAGFNLQC